MAAWTNDELDQIAAAEEHSRTASRLRSRVGTALLAVALALSSR
jgi:hypothetical protein